MFVDFNSLSEEARVWVYPCSRKFYPQELDALNEKLKTFVENWKTEETDKVSFQLLYNRFVVFALEDGSTVINTELDAQVGFILELEQAYEVSLLDKMNVCFKQGEFVQYKEVKEFKKLLKNKSVNQKTIVFDHLIQTKFDLENYWEVPITESWYNRFL